MKKNTNPRVAITIVIVVIALGTYIAIDRLNDCY